MPPREAARSLNSRDFSLEFGSGSPLPLINAWYNGYRLWTSLVRVCRRKNWWVTSSKPDHTTRRASAHSVAVRRSVIYVSCSSSFLIYLIRALTRAQSYKTVRSIMSRSFSKLYFARFDLLLFVRVAWLRSKFLITRKIQFVSGPFSDASGPFSDASGPFSDVSGPFSDVSCQSAGLVVRCK